MSPSRVIATVDARTGLRPPRPGRMLLITVLWGACFVVISWGLRDAPVLWYAALRALLAGAVLLGVACVRGSPPLASARTWLLVTALALANVTLALGAMFAATAGTDTGVAAVLSNAQPLLIVLPAWALYAERPDAATVTFILVGLAGLAVVAGEGGSGAPLALLAAVGMTAGTLLLRQLTGVDLLTAGAWHLLLGGLALAGIALAFEGLPGIAWTPRFVASLLFLALAATALAFVLWFEEARRAPLAALATWTLLVPVFGVLFGALLLGERLAPQTFAGVGLVVAAIAAAQARGRRRNRADRPTWVRTARQEVRDRPRGIPHCGCVVSPDVPPNGGCDSRMLSPTPSRTDKEPRRDRTATLAHHWCAAATGRRRRWRSRRPGRCRPRSSVGTTGRLAVGAHLRAARSILRP